MVDTSVRCHQFLGDFCTGGPPLPIPNREVKPCSADGTANGGRVGRCQDFIRKGPVSFEAGPFLFLAAFGVFARSEVITACAGTAAQSSLSKRPAHRALFKYQCADPEGHAADVGSDFILIRHHRRVSSGDGIMGRRDKKRGGRIFDPPPSSVEPRTLQGRQPTILQARGYPWE